MAEDIFEIQENTFKDKSTDLEEVAKSFELLISGHVRLYAKGGFIYTGDVLCGKVVAQKLIGLLDSFTKKGNLITSKQDLTFFKQRYLNSAVSNGILLTEEGSIAKNYVPLETMFRNALQNVGDIILHSKEIMGYALGRTEQKDTGVNL